MQVCYKKTDFLGDQVLLTAFAPGGLTEVKEANFKTYSMANTLAQELGPFGFKPEVPPLTTHSLIYSLTHSLIHSLLHPRIHSRIHSLIHSRIHSCIHLFTHSSINPSRHPPSDHI